MLGFQQLWQRTSHVGFHGDIFGWNIGITNHLENLQGKAFSGSCPTQVADECRRNVQPNHSSGCFWRLLTIFIATWLFSLRDIIQIKVNVVLSFDLSRCYTNKVECMVGAISHNLPRSDLDLWFHPEVQENNPTISRIFKKSRVNTINSTLWCPKFKVQARQVNAGFSPDLLPLPKWGDSERNLNQFAGKPKLFVRACLKYWPPKALEMFSLVGKLLGKQWGSGV